MQDSGDGRLLLGIDTGGTYTDAVLIDAARLNEGPVALIAKAKALTTADLASGIGRAVRAVLAEAEAAPRRIALVSLSTTLATNALVEGRGGRVGLVMIGFAPADLGRAGLAEALAGDPLVSLSGGHDAMGAEQAPLDEARLVEAAAGLDVEGFAVCSHFAVRNPSHEVRAREAIRRETGRPVTCSHELSARVGGPRRALTALLNARLIGMIDALVAAAEGLLAARNIRAPLMVVRGDGALVSAGFARMRPIETILSGPAASLVGGGWLTGLDRAVVSDIGGTTTDIAVLTGGRPRLDPDGARVGGWRTMVEAVAMTTHGLGGDSEVSLAEEGLEPRLTLGPRRAVPVSLLAAEAPELVHETLDRQLGRAVPGELDGRFVLPVPGVHAAGLAPREAALLETLNGTAAPADRVLGNRMQRSALARLSARGLVRVAGFTPSDAAHVTGRHSAWDGAAAAKAAALLARRRTGAGRPLAASAEALATRVLDALTRRSAELVLDAAFAADGWTTPEPSRSALAQAALDGRSGLVAPRLTLTVPLIGLGAPAPVYYGEVARLVGSDNATPAHADVANAIGAVAGHVRLASSATVTCPAEDRYRVHLPDRVEECRSYPDARALAEAELSAAVRDAAEAAGAATAEITLEHEVRQAEVEGRTMLVEARITAIAIGRPRLAEPEEAALLPAGFTGI